MRDSFGYTEGFVVTLGGDCELETMIRALEYGQYFHSHRPGWKY